MTCREASEFLLEYVSAELEVEVRAEFEAHMMACPNCERFVTQYRATVVAGRTCCQESDADASTLFPEEVVRAILAAIAKGQA